MNGCFVFVNVGFFDNEETTVQQALFFKCTFPYLSIYKLIKDGPHLMSMYCVRGCEHVFYLTFAVAAAAAASSFLRCFSRIKSASLKQTDKKDY